MPALSSQSQKKTIRGKHQVAGYSIIQRQFLRLLPYQVLLIVVNSINGIVDGIIASNMIGKDAMSAIGLYGPANHLLYALSIMLVSGSQIICGRYMGKNQYDQLDNVFSVNLVFSAIISSVTAVIMVLMVQLNMTSLMVSAEAEKTALNAYCLGMALGIPGLVLGQQLFAFLSLENRTRRTMAATLVCVAANAIGDILFVRLLNLGTFGLALGSVVSFWAFFGVMAVYYLRGHSRMHFSLKGLRWGEVRDMIRLGYPGSLSRFMEMFRCLIVNALILKYVGSVGLSSFAASNSVMAIFWSLPFGMTAVSRMLLSISIGEEDRYITKETMRAGIYTGLMIISCAVAFLVLMAEPLTRLFFQDPEDPVYGMTVTALRMLPFCMPFSVVAQHFAAYAQNMEKKLFANLMPILNGAVDVVVFSLILIPRMQMTGLYLANILNGVVCLLLILFFSIAAIRRFPRNMDDLMAMPADFGIPDEDCLNLAVRSMDEVTQIAHQVEAFCLEKNIDHRRAVLSGLAMEEMAGNVVTHGFAMGRGKHLAEIRVSCKADDVILRIRDNCVPFDPGQKLEASEAEDPSKNQNLRKVLESAKDVQYNIGLRLVYGLTQNVHYENVLGLNVLLIHI